MGESERVKAQRSASTLRLVAAMGLPGARVQRAAVRPRPTWYANAGFIAGIPAVPLIMPVLLGVITLRRAGTSPQARGTASGFRGGSYPGGPSPTQNSPTQNSPTSEKMRLGHDRTYV
jgi:hypothetical protein